MVVVTVAVVVGRVEEGGVGAGVGSSGGHRHCVGDGGRLCPCRPPQALVGPRWPVWGVVGPLACSGSHNRNLHKS
jgi:hypothetical protein